MRTRLWLLAAVAFAAAGYLQFLSGVDPVPLRKPLSSVPDEVGGWALIRTDHMTENVLANVGVEDYIMRTYRGPEGLPVSVYVGYYERQGEKDTIHSPKHCLPGAGWRPVETTVISFDTPGVNRGRTRAIRSIIQNGRKRQLVLYWYQSRGRNITDEYAAKVWLVVDSIFRKRNDGSLVRFMAPIPDGVSAADVERQVVAFARALLPEAVACMAE